jgi:hypothetical protein
LFIKTHAHNRELSIARPETLSLRNRNLQEMLVLLGEESGDLLRKVVARINHRVGTSLHKVIFLQDLFDTGLRMMSLEVTARFERAPWGYAHALCYKLRGLRSLVSATLDVPLSQTWADAEYKQWGAAAPT